MRQAIVIKNPKWERFTIASDAFKEEKEGSGSILVVRGRCKEKRKKGGAAKLAAALLLLCLFGFSVNAQEPIIHKLVSTTVAGASTNTSQGNGFIGWNIDQVAVLQVSVVGTNSSPTNAMRITFDTSDNGTHWLTDQYSQSLTPTDTSTATAISRITNTVGGKYIRFGKVENANLTAVTITAYTLSTKQE